MPDPVKALDDADPELDLSLSRTLRDSVYRISDRPIGAILLLP
jgi:hypothetical protein